MEALTVMKTFHRFIPISLMVVILVACGAVMQTSDPTIIPSPSSTEITITQTATRLPTATRRATATLRPSATPSITPTTDLTQAAIYDVLLTEHIVELTLAPQFPRVCDTQYSPPTFSPDRLWLVELCYSENDQDLILTVSQKDSQILWKLNYQDYIPTSDFVIDGGISIVHWSNDEKYAYFRSYLATSGGYCFVRGNFDESGLGLFRLNLQTGDVSTILPLRENYGWYGFAFSSTDRRLVYGVHARDFKVLDIRTGQLTDIITVNNYSEGGGLIWSPDGLRLVYSTVLNNEISEPIAYTLRLVDAQSGDEQILVESSKNCFVAQTWAEDDVMIIESYDESNNQTFIEYDLNSNAITSESTATPSP